METVKPPEQQRFKARIDDQTLTFEKSDPTGRELLAAIGRDPERFFLVFLIKGQPDQVVELDEPFDLSAPGIEELILVSKRRHLFVYVDEDRFDLGEALTNGKALLALAGKCPCRYALIQSILNQPDEYIDPDEAVDVSKPGIERFLTILKDDVTVFVNVDDEERAVVVRRGDVPVTTILAGAHLGDGYILFQEKEDGLKALDSSGSVRVEGCEAFHAQVTGGASS